MGSPLGGIYLNKLNRMQAEKSAVESREAIVVDIEIHDGTLQLMKASHSTYVGEKTVVEKGTTKVDISSSLLGSDLLSFVFVVKYRDKNTLSEHVVQQALNLEYSEKVSTRMADNKKIKFSVQCSKRYSG